MNWLWSSMLIGIFAMGKLVQFSIAQSQNPEIKDQYQRNFLVNGMDKVTYSRNFNRHREFSYANCPVTVNKFCNVSLIFTNSTNSPPKTCKFYLDTFEATDQGIASLLLPDDKTYKELVAVAWYKVGPYDHLDSFLDFLTMADCKSGTSNFIGSISEKVGNPSRVIVFHYPKIVTSASMRNGRKIIRELEFGKSTIFSSDDSKKPIYIRVNHTWVGEEQPVELGPSQGFFFIASNNTPDSQINVLYANLTTNVTRVYGSIGNIIDTTHTFPKTSGAYERYGLCWKKLERDSQVDCTQFLVRGQRSINQVSLQLPEPVDWLAVHNLREPAMLLVTGQCEDNGRCDSFKIRKIHANGHTSTPVEINNLNTTCPERPLHLSMDVTEADSKKEICFHFVCLENKYRAQSSEKLSTSLQYRRKCIDQSVIVQMN